MPNVDWYGSKSCKLKNLKSIDLLRAIKNKRYNIFRFDTLFSNLKHQSVNIINNGGWHFSNLKNIEELERKYLNDENHAEYEKLGHTINNIRLNVENRTIDYNHTAKKDSPKRFEKTKLEIANLSLLPKFIKDDLNKFKDWIVY